MKGINRGLIKILLVGLPMNFYMHFPFILFVVSLQWILGLAASMRTSTTTLTQLPDEVFSIIIQGLNPSATTTMKKVSKLISNTMNRLDIGPYSTICWYSQPKKSFYYMCDFETFFLELPLKKIPFSEIYRIAGHLRQIRRAYLPFSMYDSMKISNNSSPFIRELYITVPECTLPNVVTTVELLKTLKSYPKIKKFNVFCGKYKNPILTQVLSHPKLNQFALDVLSTGVDVNQVDAYGSSVLFSVHDWDESLLRELIKRGLRLDQKDSVGNTALINAIFNDNFHNIKILTENGANVLTTDSNGNTPLIIAVILNKVTALETLLSTQNKLEQVLAVDLRNETALIHAASVGNVQAVRMLISAGSRLEAIDVNSKTALILAAQNSHADTVSVLIESEANVNAHDSLGYSALSMACENGNLQIAALLIQNGANINHLDAFKRTPLMISARSGHFYLVELLLSNGAEVFLSDKHGNRASDHAKLASRYDIVKLLESRENLNGAN